MLFRSGSLLHVSGDWVAGDFCETLRPCGYDMHRAVVYRSEMSTSLPQDVIESLEDQLLDGIVLMSPRTSKVWIDLISISGLTSKAQDLVHICLSQQVAKPLASMKNVKIKIAQKPNLKEIIALIDQLSPFIRT